ncbi:tetratricopeptide repeat protein [Pyxidicoccus caerfyrddinensis]|jgi:tetratricopeptide (TPR) repeat protein|uniref:tetratricopeptide repeat protein n=1 Tax=Pyxidicoccus caerfyrddinensis TaxID=2709663 RepID=UPI0013DB96E4|nr:tetratricopeptide repeat protein [Pyxidicoccus caerfyrddinensis]
MNAFVAFRSAVVLLALCVLPGVALGGDVESSGSEGAGSTFQRRIERAAHLYESLEYEKALNWLAQAKQVASTIEEQVKVALYRGIVLADLGRRKQALEAFRAGLSLHPESALPLPVAPKVQRDFESVRKQVLRKLGSTDSRAPRADAEKPAEETLTAPAPLAEKPAAPAPSTPPPETASSSPFSSLRSRLGVTGAEVGKNVGSALGSALDVVVGTDDKPAQATPEAKPTAKDEP